jgi:hypothetical protein
MQASQCSVGASLLPASQQSPCSPQPQLLLLLHAHLLGCSQYSKSYKHVNNQAEGSSAQQWALVEGRLANNYGSHSCTGITCQA